MSDAAAKEFTKEERALLKFQKATTRTGLFIIIIIIYISLVIPILEDRQNLSLSLRGGNSCIRMYILSD